MIRRVFTNFQKMLDACVDIGESRFSELIFHQRKWHISMCNLAVEIKTCCSFSNGYFIFKSSVIYGPPFILGKTHIMELLQDTSLLKPLNNGLGDGVPVQALDWTPMNILRMRYLRVFSQAS